MPLRTTPKMRALTCSASLSTRLRCSLRLLPMSVTTMTPSTRCARIIASVTGRAGGASMTTRWSWASSAMSSRIRSEPTTSLGLCGMRPAGSTCRPGGVGVDERLVEGHGTREHLGEADAAVDVEERRDHGAAQVAVDEDDLLAADREGPGEQRRDRRLALGRLRARDDDRVRGGVGVREHEVGAQVPQGLADRAAQEVLGVQPRACRSRERGMVPMSPTSVMPVTSWG